MFQKSHAQSTVCFSLFLIDGKLPLIFSDISFPFFNFSSLNALDVILVSK